MFSFFMFYLDKSCENVSKFHQIKALQFDNSRTAVVWNLLITASIIQKPVKSRGLLLILSVFGMEILDPETPSQRIDCQLF